MNRKYQILPIICLFCMTLAIPHTQGGDVVTATFTFGKIEVLKAGEREWTFLKKGTVLTDNDVVRMPPFSLIRLKDANGTFLPTLAGGRESLVSRLIDEGRQRRNGSKGRRIDEPVEGRPAIDALPLGNEPKGDNLSHTLVLSQPTTLTRMELEALRHQVDSLPAEIASFIPRGVPRDNAANDDAYPNSNLYYARTLYDALSKIEAKIPNVPNHSLLYAQLLRRAGISVDLVVNEVGKLFVIFDSSVPLGNAKQISANQELIYKKPGTDTVWISIHVNGQSDRDKRARETRQNFTIAWYKASESTNWRMSK